MHGSLPAGSRLGRYEIEALIGRGGMGAVYRAHDPRLARHVAVKTLTLAAEDRELGRRFESEARLVGTLDHPNLLVVYDVGIEEEIHYLVSELLEGETLRDRLRTRSVLSPREATDVALQAARGLSAAHAAGIVHRDLKPENLFLTRDGRVKLLDFGVAKRVTVPAQSAGDSAVTALTATGAIVGTVGHMAPEQVLSEAIDARADVFALGVVLYEMLTGVAPYRRDTAISTLNAIVADDPPPLPPTVPAALGGIVIRCLEKEPSRRFQSAHDLAIALEVAGSIPSGVRSADGVGKSSATTVSRRSAVVTTGAVLASLAVGGAAGAWGLRSAAANVPSYRRLTFRRGLVRAARITPDGQSVVYSALWDGGASRLYTVRLDSGDTGALDLPDANILAVSHSGELAVALGPHRLNVFTYGTLARVPITGGTPREVVNDVKFADWAPNGRDLAIIRRVDGRDRLEFPVGRVLVDPKPGTPNGLGFARVAPDGESVAFIRYNHPQSLYGYVATVGHDGKERRLSPDYVNIHGLVWRGDELWVSASDDRPLFRSLTQVRKDGTGRVASRFPANVSLWDAHSDGRLLLGQVDDRATLMVRRAGEAVDRDLSVMDASWCADLSRDGTKLLFTETGLGGGAHGAVYLRGTDGSSPVRLGDGLAFAISPDARWVMGSTAAFATGAASSGLSLIPTGAGESRVIDGGDWLFRAGKFLPDGMHAIAEADRKNGIPQLLRVDLASGTLDPLTKDGVDSWALAPAGDAVAVARGGVLTIIEIASGVSRPLAGGAPADKIVGWTGEGVLVASQNEGAMAEGRVEVLNVTTGARRHWALLVPRDAAGLMVRLNIAVTPDGQTSAYSWHRALGTLYLASGIS